MRIRTIIALFMLLALALPAVARAQDDSDGVFVEWIDGRAQGGKLRFITQAEVCIVQKVNPDDATGTEVRERLNELVSITWGRGVGYSTGVDKLPMQYLHDGTRFRGRIKAMTDSGVQIQTRWSSPTPLGGDDSKRRPFNVPVEQVRFIALQEAGVEAASSPDTIDRLINGPTPDDDVLVMTHGESVALIHCIVLSVDERRVQVLWNNEDFKLDRSRVWGVRFAELPGSTPDAATGGGFLAIGPLGDERILGKSFLRNATDNANDRDININRPDGSRWTVNLSFVASIRFSSARVQSLTALSIAKAESVSLMGRPWPVRIGRSVTDLPLRLANRIYRDGIGCHAPARLTFDLPEPFELLVVTVGVDASAVPAGSVVFRVFDGDGKQLAESPMMNPGASSKRMVVKISGAKRIVLVADPDVRLDVGDHADWAEPRLVRPAK
ncbi:MAG: NPCBM/NEW2 domain-containing protein [Planctomycetota bacterium]